MSDLLAQDLELLQEGAFGIFGSAGVEETQYYLPLFQIEGLPIFNMSSQDFLLQGALADGHLVLPERVEGAGFEVAHPLQHAVFPRLVLFLFVPSIIILLHILSRYLTLSIPCRRLWYLALSISHVISGSCYSSLTAFSNSDLLLSMYSLSSCSRYFLFSSSLSLTTPRILFIVFFTLSSRCSMVLLSPCSFYSRTLSARRRFFSFTHTYHNLCRSSFDLILSSSDLQALPAVTFSPFFF